MPQYLSDTSLRPHPGPCIVIPWLIFSTSQSIDPALDTARVPIHRTPYTWRTLFNTDWILYKGYSLIYAGKLSVCTIPCLTLISPTLVIHPYVGQATCYNAASFWVLIPWFKMSIVLMFPEWWSDLWQMIIYHCVSVSTLHWGKFVSQSSAVLAGHWSHSLMTVWWSWN